MCQSQLFIGYYLIELNPCPLQSTVADLEFTYFTCIFPCVDAKFLKFSSVGIGRTRRKNGRRINVATRTWRKNISNYIDYVCTAIFSENEIRYLKYFFFFQIFRKYRRRIREKHDSSPPGRRY